jgi:hypothetical protein
MPEKGPISAVSPPDRPKRLLMGKEAIEQILRRMTKATWDVGRDFGTIGAK